MIGFKLGSITCLHGQWHSVSSNIHTCMQKTLWHSILLGGIVGTSSFILRKQNAYIHHIGTENAFHSSTESSQRLRSLLGNVKIGTEAHLPDGLNLLGLLGEILSAVAAEAVLYAWY